MVLSVVTLARQSVDLELLRFLVSTLFVILLLLKQHWDGTKLEQRCFEIVNSFRVMPRIAESTVECQMEILLQMRLVTQKLEAMKQCLERIRDEFVAVESTN